MKKKIKTHTFFNLGTQRALYESTFGYVEKEHSINQFTTDLAKNVEVEKIYRFDLGQNNEGCALDIIDLFQQQYKAKDIRKYLKTYPDFVCLDLRQKIASMHGISPDNILLSAGLDQMLIMIASSFLELNDKILMNSPSFFLFV